MVCPAFIPLLNGLLGAISAVKLTLPIISRVLLTAAQTVAVSILTFHSVTCFTSFVIEYFLSKFIAWSSEPHFIEYLSHLTSSFWIVLAGHAVTLHLTITTIVVV